MLSIYASQLWIDLKSHLEHINATSETIVAGVPACRHVRGSYTEYKQHSSAAQTFYMGSSISTGDDLPAVPNPAVDLIACDGEVWCEPSRTTLIGYLAVQRVRYCPIPPILSDTCRAYDHWELCPILLRYRPIPPILSI